MRVVGGGANKEDRIGVYEASDSGNRDPVAGGGAGDSVEFDLEILGGFVECCVCGRGYDPGECQWRSSRGNGD